MALTNYILHLADNALILGHRNSEWTGHGPVLEQDIALSNIALDLIGQSRNFYQLAARRLNELNSGENTTEDALAYLREVSEFTNLILVEQPNGDWAQTVLRQFYFSSYQFLLFQQLIESKHPGIAAISEKSIKETRYHLAWSSEWVIRLGDGTDESHTRMLNALTAMGPWIREIFLPVDFEFEASDTGAGSLPDIFERQWYESINAVLRTATLPLIVPAMQKMQPLAGKNGVHSPHLDQLLAEMQVLQRSYPGCVW